MPNLSTQLRDRILRHEIALRGFSNATVRKIIGLLSEAEADLERQIRKRVGWIAERGFDASPHTLKRLEENLKEVRAVLKEAYRAAGKAVRSDLEGLARVEAGWIHGAISGGLEAIGVELGVGLAEGELLRAIVNKRPFQGGLLRDWFAKLERDAAQRLSGAIRQGLLQGESIDAIVRRVRGTRAGRFADGILAMNRRDAESVVRTAVSHVANGARDATYAENADLIEAVQVEVTLDARTCSICIPYDGKKFSLPDHKPIGHSLPWGAGAGRWHHKDRCTSIPVLKSWKELGIDAEELTGEVRQALPKNDGSGAFVSSDTTFGDWIKRQPTAVQNQVLGTRRAQLMRSGKATFNQFFDRRGHFLTLEELEAA